MKMRDLLKLLAATDQEVEVEFVVARADGKIIAMEMERQADSMKAVLNLFGSKGE